jgi:hypothetical protein
MRADHVSRVLRIASTFSCRAPGSGAGHLVIPARAAVAYAMARPPGIGPRRRVRRSFSEGGSLGEVGTHAPNNSSHQKRET